MSDHRCAVCKEHPPAFICFCEEVLICKTCISKHLLDFPDSEHKPMPVDSNELEQLITSAKKDRECSEPLLDSDADSKRKAQKALLELDLKNLHSFQSQSLLNLQQVRYRWIHEVEQVIEEFSQILSQRALILADAIKQKIAHLDDPTSPPADLPIAGRESFLDLLLHVKDVDLAALLRKNVEIRLEIASGKTEGVFLYKFFGGTDIIGVFDPRTESIVKRISAGQMFFHNSCSCLSPSGNVLVTGGSLTGKSRSDCILFTPLTSSSRDVHPMQIARRSHASILHGDYCYVFGGLVDQERTSLCERYQESTNKWESIGQMKERRAYLGCCEFRGKLYICGGTANSCYEVLNLETLTFQLAPLNQLAVEDFCSLLAWQDTILVFHGNYRGEISRWQPETNMSADVAKMCYGNSWSSCAPLLFESTVYLLRSDGIYCYNLDTGSSSYVLRMTKSTKKRMAIDE